MASVLAVKKFQEDARLPLRATMQSAGFDLFSAENLVIPSLDSRLIDTGIGFTVPEGTYGRIAPRSSLALKGIDVFAGVVDRDYRDSVKVLLMNHSAHNFKVSKGDRIAQLLLEKIDDTAMVREVLDLPESDRVGGFGSTGR